MCPVLGLVRKSHKAEYEERGGSLGQVLGSTVKKGRVFPWILRRDWEAMEAYKKWVRENKDYVHSLESLANVSSYLNFYKVHHFLCYGYQFMLIVPHMLCLFFFIGLFMLFASLGFQFGQKISQKLNLSYFL